MYSYSSIAGLRGHLASAESSAIYAQADAFRARREAAAYAAAAADETVAAATYAGAAKGHAAVSMDLRSQLMSTTADRDRLQDRLDDKTIENSRLIAHCTSLLAEVAALRARRT